VGTRSSDFNYKVALASGLKSLQAGRLRQAEEQFRYLLTRFPAADGGYRGLAKVLIEQEDRPAALRMLLDGGAAVAKAGQRTGAIGLYRDATALDPQDLTAHRRLAAALMLADDRNAATAEFVRYIQAALLLGSRERARLEAEFALQRLPHSSELVKVARTLGFDVEDATPAPAGGNGGAEGRRGSRRADAFRVRRRAADTGVAPSDATVVARRAACPTRNRHGARARTRGHAGPSPGSAVESVVRGWRAGDRSRGGDARRQRR
jgi:tetratricopeptide (TPR) repeat protein